MDKINILSISITIGRYEEFVSKIIESGKLGQSKYTCLANVHMLVEAYWDNTLAKVIRNADYITADGMPLTWALRFLSGVTQDRVAGMSLLPDLLDRAEKQRLPVFFYGGSPELLANSNTFIEDKYPSLHADYFSPPFRELTSDETDATVQIINNSGAKLVFVVLGCPKQERWMASMKGRINAVLVGVGAALPVMVGVKKRAPKWMQKCGLEWLFRLLQEPRRLFKRYAVTNTLFVYLFLKEYFKVKRNNRSIVRYRKKNYKQLFVNDKVAD
jgi:N-acetylglucosaminyldiphosphoundecaprenol N-acetyl-beta-D-mannosaminyltransferase